MQKFEGADNGKQKYYQLQNEREAESKIEFIKLMNRLNINN